MSIRGKSISTLKSNSAAIPKFPSKSFVVQLTELPLHRLAAA